MIASDAPARLVVRIPNWLGDAVMAIPSLVAVRNAFPQAHLALAGEPSVLPIFSESSDIHPQELLAITRATARSLLQEGRFDSILLLTNSFRSAWVARQSGIGERWGYAAGARGPLLTKAVRRPRESVHQSEYYLRLVQGIVGSPKGLRYTSDEGVAQPFRAAASTLPQLAVTDTTRLRAARLLEQHGVTSGTTLIGFAPGAAYGHAKRWPPERVARVIERLSRERGIRSVLFGAAGDREAGRAIESTLPSDIGVVNLIGRTDLRLLMGAIRACRAFVSNDSGAMHLAAALGVPVTAIFGPTNDRATAPLGDHDVILKQVFCRPCMLRECPIDHRCMKRISEEDVYGAVTARMDRHA